MTEDNGRWPGLLGGLRVPIDPRAIFLGMIAFALFMGGVWGFQQVSLHVWQKGSVRFDDTETFLRTLYHSDYWFKAATGIWALLIWSIIGGAINRIIAVRLAKDDSIGIGEALAYSRRRFLSYFATPLVLLALISFLLGCNALAGWAGEVPWGVGPILYILLYILVLFSSLFILILTIGLVFGFNLISSAVSTEGCDGIEASISVYNYIFARPWPYIAYHLLIYASVLFLSCAGDFLINTTLKSTFLFNRTHSYHYRYGEKGKVKEIVVVEGQDGGLLDGIVRPIPPRTMHNTASTRYYDAAQYEKKLAAWGKAIDAWNKARGAEPEVEKLRQVWTDATTAYTKDGSAANKKAMNAAEKAYKLKKKIVGVAPSEKPTKPREIRPHNWMVWDFIQGTRVVEHRPSKPGKTERPKRVRFGTEHVGGAGAATVRILCWVMFVVVWLLRWLVAGYVLTYALAASTTVYFLLRREVDGTEFEELYEGDEAEFDFTEEAAAPAAPAPRVDSAPPAPAEEAPAEASSGEEAPAEQASADEPAGDSGSESGGEEENQDES